MHNEPRPALLRRGSAGADDGFFDGKLVLDLDQRPEAMVARVEVTLNAQGFLSGQSAVGQTQDINCRDVWTH
jgi:hypothetical protein